MKRTRQQKGKTEDMSHRAVKVGEGGLVTYRRESKVKKECRLVTYIPWRKQERENSTERKVKYFFRKREKKKEGRTASESLSKGQK